MAVTAPVNGESFWPEQGGNLSLLGGSFNALVHCITERWVCACSLYCLLFYYFSDIGFHIMSFSVLSSPEHTQGSDVWVWAAVAGVGTGYILAALCVLLSEMGSHFHGSPDRTLVKPFWSVKLRWMVTASGIQRNICSLFEVAVLHILQQKMITSPTQVFSYQLFMKLHASMVDLHKFSFHYSTKAEANNCVEKGYILLL